MTTLRDKINAVLWAYTENDTLREEATRAVMREIAGHIEWTDPKDCGFGHVYSDCGTYEINNHFTLYERPSNRLSGPWRTLDEAKRAAQAHKEAQA